MNETEIQSRQLVTPQAPGYGAAPSAGCPFRDGPETLDLLLAEIGTSGADLFDAALDLRSIMSARTDAAGVLAHLYRLRALLDGRHYLAFYRVRCWVHRQVRAEVRAWRGAEWRPVGLPRDCARFEAAVNICLASLATGPDGWHELAQVRFRFASAGEREDAVTLQI